MRIDPSRVPRRWSVLALVMAIAFGGCAGGAELRYYLIDPAPGPALRDDDAALSVRIVDLDVPQYLERFQIARRADGNRIAYSPNEQWGEPLRDNLLRTLASNLGAVLDTPDVSTPLARLASRPDIAVWVHVERFEQDVDGDVRIEVRWQVSDPDTGAARTTQRAELEGRVTGSGTAAVVEVMQGLFGELGDRIGASLLDALERPG